MEEAILEFIMALKNLGMEALSWFDKVFPPETRADKITHWIHIAYSYLIAALVLVVQMLKEAPAALKNSGEEAWAWFNEAYPPETRAENINYCIHVAQSYLIAAVVFMVQKLKEAPAALKNSGLEAWAWFDEAYPPETRAEKINHCIHEAQSYLSAAVVVLGEAITFMVQKLKEAPAALKNGGEEAWAWFDEACPPEVRAEKMKQWKHIAESYIIAAVALVEEAMQFIVQKLKEAPAALKNAGEEALAWFDKVFPPETTAEKMAQLKQTGVDAWAWFYEVFEVETRVEEMKQWVLVARPYLIAAVVLMVALQICRCCYRGAPAAKMMKAPGRNIRISRANFQANPGGYFRELRAR